MDEEGKAKGIRLQIRAECFSGCRRSFVMTYQTLVRVNIGDVLVEQCPLCQKIGILVVDR